MRLVGYVLLACILLSLVQAALSALVIIVVVLLIVGVFYRPAETFGFLAFGLVSSLFQTHPLAGSALVGLAIVAGIVLSKRRRIDDRTPKPLLLTAKTTADVSEAD